MAPAGLIERYNHQALQEVRQARLLLQLSLVLASDPHPQAQQWAEELLERAFLVGAAPFHALLTQLEASGDLPQVRVAHDGVLVPWPLASRIEEQRERVRAAGAAASAAGGGAR